MRIPLIHTVLNFEARFFRSPNIKRLERELSEFFDHNSIEGHDIKAFRIEYERIIPEDPRMEEVLPGNGSYEEAIRKMGEKYGIEELEFAHFCYHK